PSSRSAARRRPLWYRTATASSRKPAGYLLTTSRSQPKKPSAQSWWIAVLDDSDVADALGYHDVTKAGLPVGKVFAKTDLQAGSSVSATLSHELCEMHGDPDINLIAFVETGPHAGMYAYETADPVEADDLGLRIDGVLLSDFVYPSYFESFRK